MIITPPDELPIATVDQTAGCTAIALNPAFIDACSKAGDPSPTVTISYGYPARHGMTEFMQLAYKDMIQKLELSMDQYYPPSFERHTWSISVLRKMKAKQNKTKPVWPPYVSVPVLTAEVAAPTAKDAIRRFIRENPEYGHKRYEVKATNLLALCDFDHSRLTHALSL